MLTGFEVWEEPLVTLRLPKLFNLRRDPFERAEHEAMGYKRWRIDRVFMLVPAQAFVGNFIGTFKKYPAATEAGNFQSGRGAIVLAGCRWSV